MPGLALSADGDQCGTSLYWACVSSSGGQNPCWTGTGCTTENPPEQCTAVNNQGITATYAENAWSASGTTPWPTCTNTQPSGPGPQCGLFQEPCGVTTHYIYKSSAPTALQWDLVVVGL